MRYITLDCHKQYDHDDSETRVGSKRLGHIKEDFREFIDDRAGIRMVIELCSRLVQELLTKIR